jgi:hypothetical protein
MIPVNRPTIKPYFGLISFRLSFAFLKYRDREHTTIAVPLPTSSRLFVARLVRDYFLFLNQIHIEVGFVVRQRESEYPARTRVFAG